MIDKLNLPDVVRERLAAAEIDFREVGLANMRRGELRELRPVEGRIEIRSAEDGSTFGVVGYGSVTDTPYPIMGGRESLFGWDETIVSGAFDEALAAGDNVRFLVNHDSTTAMGVPLASTKSGTLTLAADQLGLRYDAPNLDLSNPVVQALRSSMSIGALDGSSFAFIVGRQEWNDDYTERFITQIDKLYDVSAVVYPGNPAAPSAPRSEVPPASEVRLSLDLARETVATWRHRRPPAA